MTLKVFTQGSAMSWLKPLCWEWFLPSLLQLGTEVLDLAEPGLVHAGQEAGQKQHPGEKDK